ncbi:MAG: hypothetical protein KAR16_05080, partial [Bacteroidales bacterium]|nr:hypothetical protein [Bacteroidales bacterium]
KKQKNRARSFFKQATEIPVDNSEYLYYRALSQNELGLVEEAKESSTRLLKSGEEALEKEGETDFFAKFGERSDLNQRNASAHYKMALGYQSSGQTGKAQKAFDKALELHNSILWANVYNE